MSEETQAPTPVETAAATNGAPVEQGGTPQDENWKQRYGDLQSWTQRRLNDADQRMRDLAPYLPVVEMVRQNPALLAKLQEESARVTAPDAGVPRPDLSKYDVTKPDDYIKAQMELADYQASLSAARSRTAVREEMDTDRRKRAAEERVARVKAAVGEENLDDYAQFERNLREDDVVALYKQQRESRIRAGIEEVRNGPGNAPPSGGSAAVAPGTPAGTKAPDLDDISRINASVIGPAKGDRVRMLQLS